MNATFGNATEVIICLFALQNGLIRVVQLSLLGSILSNVLLVQGCAFFLGGISHLDRGQKFSKVKKLLFAPCFICFSARATRQCCYFLISY